MLISKIDVAQADSGAKWPKIPLQVCSYTTKQKLFSVFLYNHMRNKKCFLLRWNIVFNVILKEKGKFIKQVYVVHTKLAGILDCKQFSWIL